MNPYYQQGDITIYHGDCREILPKLPSASVQFIFTDPPYGHNNNNNDLIHRREAALGKKTFQPARPIQNDGFCEANELVRFVFKESNRLLEGGGCCCCCCCGGGPDPQFARWSLWMDEAIGFKQMVIWDKGPIGMGWHYRRSYETVLVGEKRGGRCRWFDDSKKVENIIRHIRKIIPRKEDHPTPKPVALAAHFIRIHTQRGDLVLDPVMGAGSTLIAALQMDRSAIGIEIEEKYCEMAARRLEAAASVVKV